MKFLRLTLTAVLLMLGMGVARAAPDLTIFEFYHAGLAHYFYAASAEADGIDRGAAGPGWVRTGITFWAWSETAAPTGSVPVCRFYAAGPNSHVFTAWAPECTWLRDLEQTQRQEAASNGLPFLGWGFEAVAFYAMPAPAAGASGAQCSGANGANSGVMRAYNGRGAQNDANHRLTPNRASYEFLLGRGWHAEGTAFCVASWAYQLPPGLTAAPDGGPLPGQVRPADVLIPDQKIDFARPPARFKAAQGWAQAVTMSKNQRGETAFLEMDFLRLREEDPASGATIVVAEAAFDFSAVHLPCAPGGRCDGGLWEREPWFGTDAHSEMWNSAVAGGLLQIDLAPTPSKVAHWWTPRTLNKAGRRYFIETRFRITGQAALQLGVDYWVALDSQWTEPQDVRCERGNNCQGWASIWFGDTGGVFVTKIVPLY